jgi:hypothetical protein
MQFAQLKNSMTASFVLLTASPNAHHRCPGRTSAFLTGGWMRFSRTFFRLGRVDKSIDARIEN